MNTLTPEQSAADLERLKGYVAKYEEGFRELNREQVVSCAVSMLANRDAIDYYRDRVSVPVPELDFDKMMLKQYGTRPSIQGVFERRVVANLLHRLEEAGFTVSMVDNGDEVVNVWSIKGVMEELFNCEVVHVTLCTPTGEERWLRLIAGNGESIISDWGVPEESDGFDEVLRAFETYDFA